MAIKKSPKAVAMQRAVATGEQIDSLLGGFKRAATTGIPAGRDARGETPEITAEDFVSAAKEAFGEDAYNALLRAADALSPEPSAQPAAPVAS